MVKKLLSKDIINYLEENKVTGLFKFGNDVFFTCRNMGEKLFILDCALQELQYIEEKRRMKAQERVVMEQHRKKETKQEIETYIG